MPLIQGIGKDKQNHSITLRHKAIVHLALEFDCVGPGEYLDSTTFLFDTLQAKLQIVAEDLLPIMPDRVKKDVLRALKEEGMEFEAVADLCQTCAERDPALQRWAQADSIRIVACYPRAVKWLFHGAGAPLANNRVEYLNMRCQSAEEITSLLLGGESRRGQGKVRLEKTGDWVP